jgi:hypothetical protein
MSAGEDFGCALGILGLGCGLEAFFWGYVVLCIFWPPALFAILSFLKTLSVARCEPR